MLTTALAALCVLAVAPGTPTGAAARKRRASPTTRPAAVKAVLLTVDASSLPEVSGCAVSRRDTSRVWLHNDSADAARVIPVDLRSGVVGVPVVLEGIEAVDVEDIAITPSGDLILGDIGDNQSRRQQVMLYRFGEPRTGATIAEAVTLQLHYPDGPHDAEALVVTPDGTAALIITKSPSGVASVFRAELAAPAGPQTMTLVGTVTIAGEGFLFPNMVTAADVLGAGAGIVLRTYQYGYVLRTAAGKQFASALAATPQRFDLPAMIQGEAICSSPDGTFLVTASEARGAATFPLALVPAPR